MQNQPGRPCPGVARISWEGYTYTRSPNTLAEGSAVYWFKIKGFCAKRIFAKHNDNNNKQAFCMRIRLINFTHRQFHKAAPSCKRKLHSIVCYHLAFHINIPLSAGSGFKLPLNRISYFVSAIVSVIWKKSKSAEPPVTWVA